MNTGLELSTSYSPALYSPPSPTLWSQSGPAAAGSHERGSLTWKVSGPPPSSLIQQQSSTSSSFRHADGPSTAAGSLGSRPCGASTASKPFAATATAAVFTSAAAPAKGSRNAVLGPALAGYTSVVTRTPISPSGYAVPVQPKQPGAALQHQQQHQQQQQLTQGTDSIRVYQDPQPLLGSPHRGQAAEFGYSPSSTTHHQQPTSSAAAAAAAALAALSGGQGRTPSGGGTAAGAAAAAAGSYSQQYSAKRYTPPPVPASPSSGGRGSLLLWNIQQQPPPQASAAAAGGQHSGPVAGRRAATAGFLGQFSSGGAAAYGAGAGSYDGSSSSARPASQEAGSPGLLKLKQLSTARLVRRLGTPPLAQQDSCGNSDRGGFGTGPAPSAAAVAGPGSTQLSSPIAGRRAAAAAAASPHPTNQPPWQQPQQQMLPAGQNSQQPQQQQQQEQPQLRQQQQQAERRQPYASVRQQGSTGAYRRSSSEGGSSSRGPSQAPMYSAAHGSSSSSSSTRKPGSSADRPQHSSPGGFSAQLQSLPAGAEYVEVDRQPCPSCGRCFAPPALQQHMRICDKVFGQKRKVFDVKSQRLQGTGAAAVAQRRGNSAGGKGRQQQPQAALRGGAAADKRPAVSAAQAKKSKWQMQSEQLRAAMRATRPQAAGSAGGTGPSSWGGAAQVEEVEDTRVQCPHCGRRFAELVAERHIPKCSDIIAKPTRLKAAGGRAAYMRVNSGGSR